MKQLILIGLFMTIVLSSCFEKEPSQIARNYVSEFESSKTMYKDSLDLGKFPVWEEHSVKEYDKYNVKKKILKTLDLKDVEVKIIGAAWCSDTREQVSRFLKVLEEVKIDPLRVQFYMLDRDKKKAGDTFISNYPISKIPEFVIYRSGELVGSILETPKKSLEEDLVEILRK